MSKADVKDAPRGKVLNYIINLNSQWAKLEALSPKARKSPSLKKRFFKRIASPSKRLSCAWTLHQQMAAGDPNYSALSFDKYYQLLCKAAAELE